MKSEIYNALAGINRSFDVTLESLTILKMEGVLTDEYVRQQTEISEELRAGINHMILDRLQSREAADWAHYGQMKNRTAEELKHLSDSNLCNNASGIGNVSSSSHNLRPE